ncbi:MAG: 50S ribosomal protein L21 [Bacillota bacterium]|jgi:large subunit ribosomal protein L21
MYAIIECGGKQYKVAEGDTLNVELLSMEEGAALTIDKVLAVINDGKTTIGSPFVEGAKVECKILSHGKGKKIDVFRYKPKKNVRVKKGHRQPFTKLQIEKITA